MITQSTGEDWNDVKLSLSTAVPSIGGNVPELETQNVRVKVPSVRQLEINFFILKNSDYIYHMNLSYLN